MNANEIVTRTVQAVAAGFSDMTRIDLFLAALAAATACYSFLSLWAILRREAINERMAAWKIGAPRDPGRNRGLDWNTAPPAFWHQRLGATIAASVFVGPTDRVRLAKLLADAGLRGGAGWLATLVAIKLGTLIAVALSAWFAIAFYGFFAQVAVVRFLLVLGAVLVGWRLPDFGLLTAARRRRQRIDRSLPDALDLLVITSEAGLSLEQGIEFVSREMAKGMPELGQELRITSAELRVLGDRRMALRNFAARIQLPAARSIVATLIQTMRYGTPLAQSLRVLAAEMRTARMLRMEARAARMPVLLTIPLMGFILPSLVMVIVGPAILQIVDMFHSMLNK